eukprot:TRINITY_DN67656_c3_g1_i1.p1 TRINITY_DN67656_c3_g1~~TRINITY_DN67656_c3_g1_i1.p1  ORF type:complete len:111 (+),score=22.85 TRINITY_DN67656_c3_g1_i1:151-483(+)
MHKESEHPWNTMLRLCLEADLDHLNQQVEQLRRKAELGSKSAGIELILLGWDETKRENLRSTMLRDQQNPAMAHRGRRRNYHPGLRTLPARTSDRPKLQKTKGRTLNQPR